MSVTEGNPFPNAVAKINQMLDELKRLHAMEDRLLHLIATFEKDAAEALGSERAEGFAQIAEELRCDIWLGQR